MTVAPASIITVNVTCWNKWGIHLCFNELLTVRNFDSKLSQTLFSNLQRGSLQKMISYPLEDIIFLLSLATTRFNAGNCFSAEKENNWINAILALLFLKGEGPI